MFGLACAALLVAAAVHAGWLCEDAFITLRTVDNWVNGYGLRWNVAERVQSFTHPLWLFVLTPFHWMTRSPIGSLLLPSLLTTAAFAIVFVRNASDRVLAGAMLLLLSASKGFVEFSSPGLENPLSHLLLAIYLYQSSKVSCTSIGLWRVMLVTALICVTRLDLLWLILPSLALAIWHGRAQLLQARTYWALAPFVVWEAFSLAYYGFPLPNTAYAKLSTGVPLEEVAAQGLRYLEGSLRYDPVTVIVMMAAFLAGLWTRRPKPACLALGLLSWSLYLVRVGGDFMIGRLLTPALVVAVWILMDVFPRRARWVAVSGAAVCVALSLSLPRSPLWGAPRHVDEGWLPERMTDERALAYEATGLWRKNPKGPEEHHWVASARTRVERGGSVLVLRSVGIVGYFLGPEVHIVDQFGLGDPLLSRLPAEPRWSPGHFSRRIPTGYVETLSTGKNRFQDPALGRLYEELQLITRGPLFDRARWHTIWRWNTTRQPGLAD